MQLVPKRDCSLHSPEILIGVNEKKRRRSPSCHHVAIENNLRSGFRVLVRLTHPYDPFKNPKRYRRVHALSSQILSGTNADRNIHWSAYGWHHTECREKRKRVANEVSFLMEALELALSYQSRA